MTQEKSKVILGDQFYWNEMMGLWLMRLLFIGTGFVLGFYILVHQ